VAIIINCCDEGGGAAGAPLLANLIPQANDAGVLIASAAPARLFEAWVGDYQNVETRYLLAFNRVDAPTPGAVPAYAALQVFEGWLDYDFTTDAGPVVFSTGLVVALSTTPRFYTAIVPATSFAMTVRYKVG
jgi:hypothetical protein